MQRTRLKPFVFLGGGRITSALVAGLRKTGYPGPLVVHDLNRYKLQRLRREYDVAVEAKLITAMAHGGILIIAVRPGSVRDLLKQVAALQPSGTAVSLAAGVPIKNLELWLPSVAWVRAMPSPVCRSGHGLTAVTFAEAVSKKDRALIRSFFGCVGDALEISEKQFDAFTVVYSSSHGYHALAALADGAEKLGLDGKTAIIAAAHALGDGIAYWKSGRESLEDLLAEAATPGGVAAATMHGMNKTGYQRSILGGLKAGLKQARNNSKTG